MDLRMAAVGSQAYRLGVIRGIEVVRLKGAVSPLSLSRNGVSHLVSFGYPRLFSREVIDFLGGNVYNIHISLLPWNRGSNPNFWSWYCGTPKGVTLHRVIPQLDKGPIVFQREIVFERGETLATSYEKLCQEGVELFRLLHGQIINNSVTEVPQPEGGTYHNLRDFEQVRGILRLGWETPCDEIEERGRKEQKRPC